MNAVVIEYKGERYAATGKIGTCRSTGELMAEYESIDDPGKRIWVSGSGRVEEDA